MWSSSSASDSDDFPFFWILYCSSRTLVTAVWSSGLDTGACVAEIPTSVDWSSNRCNFLKLTLAWLSQLNVWAFIYLRHSLWSLQQLNKFKLSFPGKTCPFPGSLPHGNWTCEMQEIPILGTSFLEEDARSFPGLMPEPLSNIWPICLHQTFLLPTPITQ